MRKSNITNLNILGITPETENNIPSQLTDLADGSTIIESITSLENNKQNNLSSEQLKAVNSGITHEHVEQIATNATNITNLQNQIGQINDLLTNINSGEGV